MSHSVSRSTFLDNISAWKIFLLAAQYGSLSKASRASGVDASQISRSIKKLEDELGVPLFERTTHAVRLTAFGERIKPIAVNLLQSHERFRGKLNQAIDQTHTEVISIFGAALILEELFCIWAADFAEMNAGVSFDFKITDRTVRPEEIGFDMGIMFGKAVTKDENAFELGSLKYAFAASPDYLNAHGVPQHPSELAGHRVFTCNGDMYFSIMMRKDDQWERFSLRPVLSGTSVSILTKIGLTGRGIIAHAYDYQLHEAFARGKLIKLFPDWELPTITTSLLVSPESRTRPMVQKFVKFVESRWLSNPDLTPHASNANRFSYFSSV